MPDAGALVVLHVAISEWETCLDCAVNVRTNLAGLCNRLQLNVLKSLT